MSKKQTASDLSISTHNENTQGEAKPLIGIEAHKAIYKDFYDYVNNHERRYSKPKNFVRAGCAVALISTVSYASFMAGADAVNLAIGGAIFFGVPAYLYGLHIRNDYRMAGNCRMVTNHHNLVIDYLNNKGTTLDNGEPLKHNQSFPVDYMEEVDNEELSTYVNKQLERKKRNREAMNAPVIAAKPARANKEGRQIIYSNRPR